MFDAILKYFEMGKKIFLKVKTFKTVILIFLNGNNSIFKNFNKIWFFLIVKFLVISSMIDRRELLFTDSTTQVEMKNHIISNVDTGASSTIAEESWQLISHFSSKSNF